MGPGDGGLDSSVKIHMGQILGESEAKEKMLTFLPGHPCRLPNVCISLLDVREEIQRMRDGSLFEITQCFVHGDLHGDNIMVDAKDNRFLIDFGKTSLGHPLEDVSWLEGFVLMSYTDIMSDEELGDALHMLPALAPPNGLTLESCDGHAMESALTSAPVSARMAAMWRVVKSLRSHLGRMISDVASMSHGHPAREHRKGCIIATLLYLRSALFFLGARENKEAPRRRKFALALACAYGQSLQALV